ncbi:MAG: carboxynorspermidine decarboxylase [Kiritimatiellae bacterium]|nr:carboxynorspermidine decarboxylase [Kiritimatiellia bacterium]
MTPAQLDTPAYVVDCAALERNLAILDDVRQRTGCRILLALKAFSMYETFPLLRRGLDGCCASSLHEARLAREEFGGEVHVHGAAFSDADMAELSGLADHITFNSFAQWERYRALPRVAGTQRTVACGLRINPEHSEGATPLYDPCAPGSRLGIRRAAFAGRDLTGLSGLHCHNLCEHNADAFERTLQAIEQRFGDLLPHFSWFNFGGGHHITRPDYDLDLLCRTIAGFRARHAGEIYLEPGEAVALNAGTLATTVLDVVTSDIPIAILDASCTCHMPDVLEMPYRPRVFRDPAWNGTAHPGPQADRGAAAGEKPHVYRLAGPSCLAGDVIGEYAFDRPLTPGDRLVFEDMAIYTMVKNSTFNGIRLPDIVVRELDGRLRVVRRFGYEDFKMRLS